MRFVGTIGVLLLLSSKCQRERDSLSHYQKREECIVHYYIFRGTIVNKFLTVFKKSEYVPRGSRYSFHKNSELASETKFQVRSDLDMRGPNFNFGEKKLNPI
jgi:hypothetical protein